MCSMCTAPPEGQSEILLQIKWVLKRLGYYKIQQIELQMFDVFWGSGACHCRQALYLCLYPSLLLSLHHIQILISIHYFSLSHLSTPVQLSTPRLSLSPSLYHLFISLPICLALYPISLSLFLLSTPHLSLHLSSLTSLSLFFIYLSHTPCIQLSFLFLSLP